MEKIKKGRETFFPLPLLFRWRRRRDLNPSPGTLPCPCSTPELRRLCLIILIIFFEICQG